jgi:signal transduction histidine kinase
MFKNMSYFGIRKQLIFGITLVHALLMSIFVLDMNYRQKNFLKQDTSNHAKELAETIASNSISWVLSNDLVGLQEIVSSQKLKSKVNNVMVLSNENKILAHTDLSKVGKYIAGKEIENLFKTQSTIEIDSGLEEIAAITPIFVQNRKIGKVYVSLNFKEVSEALMTIVRDGLIYTVLAIAIGALFAWVMAKYLTQAIEALTRVSAKIKAGQRGLRAKVFRKDEIGELTKDFNSMLDALEGNEKNLIESQKNLSVAKELAEVAGKSKAEFLANMSHEIRTPLNAVVGFCEILEDTKLDLEQKDFLFRIKNSGQVLQCLIDDILEFSRIESSKIHLMKAPFNLVSEIKKVVEMHDLKIQQKNLYFHLFLSSDIPGVIIGDSFRLNQILNNLLSNAVKFTSSGEISFDVNVLSCEQNLVTLEFRVKDTGIGISKDQLDNLFNPFTQADNSITKKYGGTGLGLTISKRLAHLMNGDIRVESEPGVGSTFIVTVIFECLNDKNLEANPELENVIKTTTVDYFENIESFKNKTALIVDDNLVNLELAGITLQKFGFKTLFAENGLEAVETVENKGESIDLILMDLQMPVLDGFKAAQRIRLLPHGIRIPIIAISARAFDSDRDKCFENGMDDHIAKPFIRKELVSKLKKYLET